jgi:uncharacterized BrkB/YihY/UPF0761 family membrane protein
MLLDEYFIILDERLFKKHAVVQAISYIYVLFVYVYDYTCIYIVCASVNEK